MPQFGGYPRTKQITAATGCSAGRQGHAEQRDASTALTNQRRRPDSDACKVRFGARLCGNGTRLMLLSIPLRAKPL
jgi:hypothetical protein